MTKDEKRIASLRKALAWYAKWYPWGVPKYVLTIVEREGLVKNSPDPSSEYAPKNPTDVGSKS